MQNMQHIINETNEPETTYTATKPVITHERTVAQLIEQRRRQRAQEQQSELERIERNAADRAERAIMALGDQLKQRMSETTYAGLQNAGLDYHFHRDDDDSELEYAYATFWYNVADWTVAYRNGWHLTGPNGYDVQFTWGWHGDRYDEFDAKLLDALDGYDAWLEQTNRRVETTLPSKRTTPHYTLTQSGFVTNGLLHIGAHVTVWIVTTDSSVYQQTHYIGTVESYDDHWLLLTCDGPSQQQRLIAVHRIDEIVPEPAAPAKAEKKPTPLTARTASEYPKDTEDIPF